MSKDLKPKQKLGQGPGAARRRILTWMVSVAVLAGGGYAAYRYNTSAPIEIASAKVRRAEFTIVVRARGEIKAINSTVLSAPQVPDARITKLAESGKAVKKGDVVVEFDAAQIEQNYLDRQTSVRTVDSQIVQQKASHKITDEADAMNLMTAEYDVQRMELEANKASIVSAIEGAKTKIDVGLSEGALQQVKTTIKAHDVQQNADLDRLNSNRDKTLRDMDRLKGYLSKMVITAPTDGIINILPNPRSGGSFGQTPPSYKEGDRTPTGAPIAEIPDLSEMRIELKLDEVDRGKVVIGQSVKVRVDAIPDQEFAATLDWISPIAALQFRGMGGASEKSFPARATLKSVEARLRPGMSATGEILIESRPNVLLIPLKASFLEKGKPAVWVSKGDSFEARPIEVGKRNETDIIVTKGVEEGERVFLENPLEAAKRAKKL